MITREEIQLIANEAAKQGATEALLALGIPAKDPLKAQAIFLHLERQYDACQTVKRHSLKTAVGIVTTSIVAYVLILIGWKSAG